MPIISALLIPDTDSLRCSTRPYVATTMVSVSEEAIHARAQRLPAHPALDTVERLILHEKRGNCIPVYVELPADLITPCMAYLRIAKDSKYSFLFESVIGGENVARYSFIGAGKHTRVIPPSPFPLTSHYRSSQGHQDRS